MAQVIAADAKMTLTDEPMPASQPVNQMHHSAVLGKLILLLFVLIFFGGSSIFRMLLGFGLFSSIFNGRNWGGAGAVDLEAEADLAAVGAVVGLADLAEGLWWRWSWGSW